MQLTREREAIEYLGPVEARMILAALPDHIRESFERRATNIGYPVEAAFEMALAGFLDSESLSFSNCNPRC